MQWSMKIAMYLHTISQLELAEILMICFPQYRLVVREPSWMHGALLVLIVALSMALHGLFVLAPGHGFDMHVNKGWAKSAFHLGLGESYTHQLNDNMKPNYPPFSMMIFGGIGHAHEALFPDDEMYGPNLHWLIKLPAWIADILCLFAVYIALRAWLSPRAGLLGALLIALHPALIYDSMIWGQTDSIFTLFGTLSLLAATALNPVATGIFAALAVLSKAQALVFLPPLLIVFLRYKEKLFQAVVSGCITTCAVLIPFAISGAIGNIFSVYTNSVGYYSKISLLAYNFWWGLFGDIASHKSGLDVALGIEGLTYRGLGLGIFAVLTVIILWISHRLLLSKNTKNRFIALFGSVTLIAYAFFLFNTEMHERYLFPAMVTMIPLIFLGRQFLWLYIASSALFVANLTGAMPVIGFFSLLYKEFPQFDVFVAWMQVTVFFLLLWNIAHTFAELGSTEKPIRIFGMNRSRTKRPRKNVKTKKVNRADTGR